MVSLDPGENHFGAISLENIACVKDNEVDLGSKMWLKYYCFIFI